MVVGNFRQFEQPLSVRPNFSLDRRTPIFKYLCIYNDWAKKCRWPDTSHHYIEEYNLFYGKLMELSWQTDRFVFIRYVDLIKDANAVLSHLEARMGLKKNLLSRLALRRPRKYRNPPDLRK